MVSIRDSEFYKTRLDDEGVKETLSEATEKIEAISDSKIRAKVMELYRYLKDGSGKVRFLAIAALIYFIQPFDLIPDSIPIIGYADDLVVMSVALGEIYSMYSSMTNRTK